MKKYNTKQKVNTYLSRVLIVVGLLILANALHAQSNYPQLVASKDGTQISYEVYGSGEPTLVFVHGWSCDARYWREQIPEFAKAHKIVVIDLAGHGHSGMTRKNYTMKAFGEDVKAVVEATGSQNVILIGHSMGGTVIAEATRLMPNRVIGLISVDANENIEYPLNQEEFDGMMAPFRDNFQAGTRQFVQHMLIPNGDTILNEWIMADMSAAPQSIALSAMKELLTQSLTGEAATIFDDIKAPVIVVKCDMWPVNYEGNRRHMKSFEAIELKNTDHFLMLNHPVEFNKALNRAIEKLIK